MSGVGEDTVQGKLPWRMFSSASNKKTILITVKGLISICLLAPFLFTSCKQSNNLFTNLSPSSTNVYFENNLKERPLFNILYYLYYYNGGGVATGDINNDGLADIYFTANSKGANKLYLNKGNLVFEDITEKAGVAGTADWCTGATMADVNADGLLDIYVSTVSSKYGLQGHNELFINNGSAVKEKDNNQVTFSERSEQYGLNTSCFTTQSAFFDYDRDGDMDCYILNQSHHPHANIVDTSNRRKYDTLSGDRLYRNDVNTGGKFTEVSQEAGIYQSNLGYGLGIAVGDINNDGWDDIYIGNDFHENDYYYVNNGRSLLPGDSAKGIVTFTESGAKHFGHYSRFSMGNDLADYDNDGQLDLVTVDMLPDEEKVLKTYGSDENPDVYKVKIDLRGYQKQYSKNCLQVNNGNGTSFSEVALQSGMAATDWSWSPLFADFDNDGNKDLFISSGIVKRPVDLDYIRFISDLQRKKGMDETDEYDNIAIKNMPDGASHPFLFQGNGKLTFNDVSESWGTRNMKGYFNGASYADLDNDGDLDLVINCLNAPAVILKNNATKKNYISISFKGDDGLNTFGVGCKAYIFQPGNVQYQQLMLTRGFQSSSDTRLHFGLDSVVNIDSILIVWPNQNFQVIKNVKHGQQLFIKQKDAIANFKYDNYFPPGKNLLEDITAEITCDWKHKENDFVDFNVQYLIPHAQSTRGPKLAVGDVNKDGLDDFFLCGARFQGGCLMMQNMDGKFSKSDEGLFIKDDSCEDVDAVFFDANNDGYPDLYVVSGGNEYADGNTHLADRLYINDTRGHFTPSLNDLPPLFTNKSCVAIADIDKDGDNDVFVGGLANAKKYGYAQTSHLLINDGKANFTLASMASLTDIGMVTSSAFSDINNDGWPDLIVAGEWMPVKIFMNNKGIFKGADIEGSTGLWQTISTTDVNGDGFTDILAGNWGHNTKLWAGKNGPAKLYVKDFDNNGIVEQIMAYTMDKKEYTFLAKDELEQALPVLKKAYLTYNEVAGIDVQYLFYDLFKDYKELKAETLSSSCFINDGKGNFVIVNLPDEVQAAPVFSFVPYTYNDAGSWLASGNFYGVVPYEGRYDALVPTFISYNKRGNTFNQEQKLPNVSGEVRDAKWITVAGGKKLLIVARNNQPLLFYKPS